MKKYVYHNAGDHFYESICIIDDDGYIRKMFVNEDNKWFKYYVPPRCEYSSLYYEISEEQAFEILL